MKNLMSVLLFAMISLATFSCDEQEECICIEIYDPVCSDGVEYANKCKAECAGISFTEGVCPIQVTAKVADQGSIALDGCGWVIQFEVDGEMKDHHAENLNTNFQQDQLNVNLSYKPTTETYTCGLAPTEMPKIEIVNIEEL